VKYAYDHVPFYREKFLRCGVKPEEIKTVEDLEKLPVMGKEELQKNRENLISDEFDAGKLKVVSTSGSSGRPLFTYLTRKEDDFRKAKLLRPHLVCGQKARDRWVLIGPPEYRGDVGNLQRFLGIYAPILVSVFDDAATQIRIIEKLKPDVLDGYSSSLWLLAKEVEKSGINTIRPRLMMGGAELIDKPSRRFLEEMFNAPYYDQYGSQEVEMLAWQCQERNGYHIDADTIIMQVVDEDGEEVTPGERGQVVCTSLFNYAMPYIRYAIGDIGILSDETDCPCGRKFPLMKVVEGRKDSVIVLPDGRVLSPLAVGDCMIFFKYFNNIQQYRVIQKRIDFIKVLVKKKDSGVEDSIMQAELIVCLRKTLNISEADVRIEIEFVDKIPLDDSGKIRKIVSEVNDRRAT
jgi:phenylacetate-CoA ligase